MVVERLAVLLAAGVAPANAWGHLRDGTDVVAVAFAAQAARAGDSISSALVRGAQAGPSELTSAWRGVAAAWFVATESGAPLASSLRVLAGSFRSIGDIEREMISGLAGPKSTARMVMFLPVVGVIFGVLLGFDTIGTLFGTGPGLACLVAGGGLLLVGARWNARLITKARPTEKAPGLVIDLMAIALTGGSSADRASDLVNRAARRLELDPGDGVAVARVLSLAVAAGVPAADLLRSEAELERRQARSAGSAASAVLAVRLMIPLGVCVLPAFMLLGVAPLIMSVISSTLSTM